MIENLDSEWRRAAACLPHPVEMFFPERGDRPAVLAALAICETCPVIAECLEENFFQRDGIYGNTTARQRRQMRLARKKSRTLKCIECAKEFSPTGSQRLCSSDCKTTRHMRQRRDSELRNS